MFKHTEINSVTATICCINSMESLINWLTQIEPTTLVKSIHIHHFVSIEASERNVVAAVTFFFFSKENEYSFRKVVRAGSANALLGSGPSCYIRNFFAFLFIELELLETGATYAMQCMP